MPRIIRLSRPAPQNGNDLAGLGMAFGRLGQDDGEVDFSSMDMPEMPPELPPDIPEPMPEEAYEPPPEEPAYEPPPEDTSAQDAAMAEAYGQGPAPEEINAEYAQEEQAASAQMAAKQSSSAPFNWAALGTGLKTATGLLTAAGSIYSTQQQGKIAAGAQALAQTQAQLAAQQRAGTAAAPAKGVLASMPSWALPAIIGGVALLAIGGFMLTRRPATLTNPRRRRNRRRK